MNEDWILDELGSGEDGAQGSGMIEIPEWVIVLLAKAIGSDKDVRQLYGTSDPQTEIQAFRIIGELADAIERKELKPIANRKRDYSKNQLRNKK